MKAYETHGYKVSRCTPHHAGVTKAWADIYRYVSSTAWGQAADLKDLAARKNWPIYKKAEHAFPRKPGSARDGKYLGDHDESPSASMSPVRADSPGRLRSAIRSGSPDGSGRVPSTVSALGFHRSPSAISQKGHSSAIQRTPSTESRISQRRLKATSPQKGSASPTRGMSSSFAGRCICCLAHMFTCG
jgi:hypothetical protein